MEVKIKLSPEQWQLIEDMHSKLDLLIEKLDKQVLSVKEVREMTGLSDQTIRNYISQKTLEAIQSGPRGRILITASSVKKFLSESEV